MSKISAQIWAFVVMMVALGIGVWYADSVDIDTEVRTAEETRLPGVFPPEGEENPTGLTFRYPRNWQLQADDENFSFSIRHDEQTFNIDMALSQLASSGEVNLENELLAFLQTLGAAADPADFESVDHALGAVRYEEENTADNTVTVYEVGQMTADNIIYQLRSSDLPRRAAKDILDDLDRVFASMNVENVVVPKPLFTYTLPVGWQLAGENDTSFQVVAADPTNPQQAAVVLVRLDAEANTLDLLKGFVTDAIDPEAALDDLTTPADVLGFIAESEGVTGVTEVEAADYFGLEGQKVTFTTPADGGIQEMAVMEAGDNAIIVYTRYSSEDIKTAFESQAQELLGSAAYNQPAE